jgi:hypothetical protein
VVFPFMWVQLSSLKSFRIWWKNIYIYFLCGTHGLTVPEWNSPLPSRYRLFTGSTLASGPIFQWIPPISELLLDFLQVHSQLSGLCQQFYSHTLFSVFTLLYPKTLSHTHTHTHTHTQSNKLHCHLEKSPSFCKYCLDYFLFNVRPCSCSRVAASLWLITQAQTLSFVILPCLVGSLPAKSLRPPTTKCLLPHIVKFK